MSEKDLYKMFEPFGDLEYTKLVYDKDTKESKGYGYAKFTKTSTARRAMHTINYEKRYGNDKKFLSKITRLNGKCYRTFKQVWCFAPNLFESSVAFSMNF